MQLTDTKRGVNFSDFSIDFAADNSTQYSGKIDYDHTLAALTFLFNEDGTALNNTVTVTLQVSFDEGTTWIDLTDLESALSGDPVIATHDPPNDGFAPVYRLKFAPSGTMSSETINCRVATPADERGFH